MKAEKSFDIWLSYLVYAVFFFIIIIARISSVCFYKIKYFVYKKSI